MTTHERITEAIMSNGWTKEEATMIKDGLLKCKGIIIDKHNGGWQYTNADFAEKFTQDVILDMMENPQPKGEEQMDTYDQGWKAFEEGKKETDNPYKNAKEGHPDYHKNNGWSYGYSSRKDIRNSTGR